MTQHEVMHPSNSPNGYNVCACGATQKVNNWVPEKQWHACKLCCFPNYHQHEVGEHA